MSKSRTGKNLNCYKQAGNRRGSNEKDKDRKGKDVKIKKIVQEFQDREVKDYLRGQTYNIKYNVV